LDRRIALRSERRCIFVWERGLWYACDLFPAKQIEGHDTAFGLTTMLVDAYYEVVVDAALAFGGMDQHGRNSTIRAGLIYEL